MNFQVDDLWLIPVAVILIAAGVTYITEYCKLSKQEKIKKVQEWLLYAVSMAEQKFGSGTGVLKLRYVYDRFANTFPSMVNIITFEKFSEFVDTALEKLKHYVETNKAVENLVITDKTDSEDKKEEE